VEDGRDGTATTLGAATVGVPSERLFVTGLGQIVGMNASAWLYSTDVFCTVRLDLRSAWEDQGTASHQRPSFVALTAIQGSALLTSETDTETIAAGQTVIASARCANFRINPAEGGASILKTWLPDHAAEIERPLSRQGATQREIEALYGFFGRRK